MSQEVMIAGAVFSNVPSIKVPNASNVFHSFYDVSDTTATASDVASGKYFYASDGTRTLGTKTDSGVSVVTTQDEHGGDIVTITGAEVVPFNPFGEELEIVQSYPVEEIVLGDTAYNGWTPSTTAKAIKATSNQGTQSIDTANYDYLIRYQFYCAPVYSGSETDKARVVKVAQTLYQYVYRRPSNLTNIASDTDNNNVNTTLFTTAIIDYFNASSTRTNAWSASYGLYVSATGPTFSSSSSTTPTLTIKRPAINARCSTTYFSTANAAAVDQENTKLYLKCDFFRCKKSGSTAYQAYHDIVSLYNGGLS